MPATLAGKIEYMLLDPVHGKPRYGARNKLIVALLSDWLSQQEGTGPKPIPALSDLQNVQ